MSGRGYVPLGKARREAAAADNGRNPPKDDKKVIESIINEVDNGIDGNLRTYLKANDNLRRSTLKDSKAPDAGEGSLKSKSNTSKPLSRTQQSVQVTSVSAKASKKETVVTQRSVTSKSPSQNVPRAAPKLNDSNLGSRRFNEQYNLANTNRSQHFEPGASDLTNTSQIQAAPVPAPVPAPSPTDTLPKTSTMVKRDYILSALPTREAASSSKADNVFKDSLGSKGGDSPDGVPSNKVSSREDSLAYRGRNVTFTRTFSEVGDPVTPKESVQRTPSAAKNTLKDPPPEQMLSVVMETETDHERPAARPPQTSVKAAAPLNPRATGDEGAGKPRYTVRELSKSFLDRKDFLLANQYNPDDELQALRRQILNLEAANRELVQLNNNLTLEAASNDGELATLRHQAEFQERALNRYFVYCEDARESMEVEKRQFLIQKRFVEADSRLRRTAKDAPAKGNVIQRIIRQNVKHSDVNHFEVRYLGNLKERRGFAGGVKEISMLETSQTIPGGRLNS